MIDNFILNFGLSLDQQELVKRYASPRGESSIFKHVPLDRLEEMKQLVKVLTGNKPRVMYRGPRVGYSYSTKKHHATHASIYRKYE